jgi:hypothetical protein
MANKDENVNGAANGADDGVLDTSRHEGRLTMKIIGCRPELAKDPSLRRTDTVRMCQIMGWITGLTEEKEMVDAQTGKVTIGWGLTGFFEAHNLESGEIFKGGVLYLPSGFQDQGISAIRAQMAANPSPGSAKVEFAYEFHARPDGNPSGYSWLAFPLLKTRVEDDPLASLRGRMLSASRERMLLLGKPSSSDVTA